MAGLTSAQLHNAFGIDQGIDLTTFNALGDAMQNPNGIGMSILKVRIPVQYAGTLHLPNPEQMQPACMHAPYVAMRVTGHPCCH